MEAYTYSYKDGTIETVDKVHVLHILSKFNKTNSEFQTLNLSVNMSYEDILHKVSNYYKKHHVPGQKVCRAKGEVYIFCIADGKYLFITDKTYDEFRDYLLDEANLPESTKYPHLRYYTGIRPLQQVTSKIPLNVESSIYRTAKSKSIQSILDKIKQTYPKEWCQAFKVDDVGNIDLIKIAILVDGVYGTIHIAHCNYFNMNNKGRYKNKEFICKKIVEEVTHHRYNNIDQINIYPSTIEILFMSDKVETTSSTFTKNELEIIKKWMKTYYINTDTTKISKEEKELLTKILAM